MPDAKEQSDPVIFAAEKAHIARRTRQVTFILGLAICGTTVGAFLKGGIIDKPFYWVLLVGLWGILVALNSIKVTPEKIERLNLKRSLSTEKNKKSYNRFWSVLMFLSFSGYVFLEYSFKSAFAWIGFLAALVLVYRQLRYQKSK